MNMVLKIQELRWEVPRGTSGVIKLLQFVLRWSDKSYTATAAWAAATWCC